MFVLRDGDVLDAILDLKLLKHGVKLRKQHHFLRSVVECAVVPNRLNAVKFLEDV